MGKSSKQTKQTNSTQTVQMPSYVEAAQKDLLGSGQALLDPRINAGTSGEYVAQFNDDQLTAAQGVRDMYNMGNAQGGLPTSEIQRYLNPYTQNVVDTTNRQLGEQNDLALNAIRARTAAGSAFGGSGSRGALMESEQNRNFGNTLAATDAQLNAAGYDKAVQTAQAAMGLKQQNLQAMTGIGAAGQAQQQANIDAPVTALSQLAAITPQQYGSTTTGNSTETVTGSPQSSLLQQLGGGAMSLLGMKTAGGGSLGGSLLSGLGLFSDENAKTDIKALGPDPDTGVPLYAYRYKGDPKSYPKVVGPMAQDIEAMSPGSTKRIGGMGGLGGHLMIKRA